MSDRGLRVVALTSAVAFAKADEFARSSADDDDDDGVPALFRKIVVATDGTTAGDRALAYALELAREHGATLDICTVADDSVIISGTALSGGIDSDRLSHVLEEAATAVLSAATARAAEAKIANSSSLLFGRAPEAIVTFASVRRADTIVVGTHGNHGLDRFFLGSTAWDILRASAIPTIVVPPHAEPHATSGRILVALDAPERSEATIRYAIRLAHAEGAKLILCSVVETNDLFDKAVTYGYDPMPILAGLRGTADRILTYHAALVEAAGVPFETTIVEGTAASAIADIARERSMDAIVVGTHGRRGFERLFLGSVAEAIVRNATVPVAVIRTRRDIVPPFESNER